MIVFKRKFVTSVMSSILLTYQALVLFADSCVKNFNHSYGYAENFMPCSPQK